MKWLLFLLSCIQVCFAEEMIHYSFIPEPIDVVIPCVSKDISTLQLCIKGIRNNCNQVRRVIVVSPQKLTNDAEWFDEAQFPFTKTAMSRAIFHNDEQKAAHFLKYSNHIGWIYQQLIKLYAPFVIPEISSNVLVLDADTIFLNPVEFMNEQGEPFLTTATEHHIPYFHHMQRLLPWLYRATGYSGIAHHMLLQKVVLEDLFHSIETYHGMPTWEALCSCIDPKEVHGSCLSEYEIYFNFIYLRTKQAHLRSLQWHNSNTLRSLQKDKQEGMHYVSCHAWARID